LGIVRYAMEEDTELQLLTARRYNRILTVEHLA
jgi:hypothetical protein